MIYLLFYIFFIALLRQEARCPVPNMTIRRIIPIVFTLFIGLRGANVGQDTGVYYQHYYMFGQWGCSFVEPGFDWINRFCYHQGWESWSLFLICAALTTFPVYLMMNKLDRKEYTIFAMFFYCCTYVTIANGMRQALVCGVFIFLMSFYFNKTTYTKREVAIFVIGIVLSSLMHSSVILLFPVLLFNKVPANKNVYLILYLLSFTFLFIDVSPYLPDISFGNRDYSRYVENVVIKQASGLGFFGTTVLKMLIFFCMYETDAFKKYRLLSHFVMFAFILANFGFNIPMIGRITMYFSWFVYVMIAKIYVENKTHVGLSNVFKLIFVCYFILTIHGVFSSANKLNPYTVYWQNNKYENYLWNEK